MRLPARLLVPALALATSAAVPHHATAADPPITSESVFGYNVGAVPRQALVTSVSAVWNVAAATPHGSGEIETARAVMSLGDGCVTYDCRVRDDTRIQVGTESEVDPSGAATYRAWYEIAPSSATYVPLAIDPGDEVRGTIERVSGLAALWRLTLENLDTGASWTTVTPAASMLASAQWVVLSRLLHDEFGTGYPFLPDLETTVFDEIRLNGANPDLQDEERVEFVPAFTTDVVGTASLPDADGDGFSACAWAVTCP